MAKTKWIIEPNTLTIYPKRNLRIVGLVFFILFLGLVYYLSTQMSGYSQSTAIIYCGVLLMVPLLLVWMAESKLIFNGTDRTLYRKIGFLPVGSISFDDIAAVDSYEVYGGGYSYRLFKKSNRHGKGLPVSNGYSKVTDANLIQYQNEVLPKIDELVFANAPVIPKQAIYDFEFFKEEGGIYQLKQQKIGGVIVGLIMIGITVAILLQPDFMAGENDFKRILVTYFPLIIGLVLFYMVFSSVKFDKHQRKLIHATFGGRKVKEYAFDDIIRFQIVRKTTNLIYSGTEVNAEIYLPGKDKMRVMSLKSFMGTKKIDRFLDELNTILGRI
ncbi:hypothetical protein [Pedobacter sp. MR22-3]|uniref:hypothetical protein n=1 Tax=Pedobacter sp. MR22-3 TaxID=2994552 RepID=UPI0022455BFF|nr:hypothetical protein [Pedobacter sp. MR22-3]MCX2582333.1 hypothetical protein [Pedobacter sp. MR22-3]